MRLRRILRSILLPDTAVDKSELGKAPIIIMHLWKLEEQPSDICQFYVLLLATIVVQVGILCLFLIYGARRISLGVRLSTAFQLIGEVHLRLT